MRLVLATRPTGLSREALGYLTLDELAELLDEHQIVLRRIERVAGAQSEHAYRASAARFGMVVSVHGASVLDALLNAISAVLIGENVQ
jgi:hypothetical protein